MLFSRQMVGTLRRSDRHAGTIRSEYMKTTQIRLTTVLVLNKTVKNGLESILFYSPSAL